MTVSPALEQETRRLYSRYQVEVVEAFGLCPWASGARQSGNTQLLVRDTASPCEALAALSEAAQLSCDIVLVIFPTYTSCRSTFDKFTAELIRLDAARHTLSSPPFALAAFHPAVELDSSTAERLIPFLRCSPDPTLQLVRLSALERVRKGEVEGTQFMDPKQLDLTSLSLCVSKAVARASLRQRIAAANHSTVLGPDGALIQQAIRSILVDRAATHQRLGLPRCSWEPALEPAARA